MDGEWDNHVSLVLSLINSLPSVDEGLACVNQHMTEFEAELQVPLQQLSAATIAVYLCLILVFCK